MKNSKRVRIATDSDLEWIQAIYAHHVINGSSSFETEPPSVEEIARRRATIAGHGLPFLIAENEGVVAGYAYAAPYRARTAYRFTVEDSVYVHPDHLGNGLGRALLTELIAQCKRSGRRQMVAVIGDSANAASIQLHAALGFRTVGTLEGVGFKFGRWLDTVLMQRELSPQ